MGNNKKSHEEPDLSTFEFCNELLEGQSHNILDFDRFQKHKDGYIMWEFLLTAETQSISPWESHPNNYWHLNPTKFILLFEASKKLEAKLVLVNYAKLGTKHEDKILVIWVHEIDNSGISRETISKLTRQKFKDWFVKINAESKITS
jgi:hypothetical protein